jgi:Fe-S cluster assembly protein SufD
MNSMSETTVTEKYLKLYRDNIVKISDISSPYINSFRDKAFERFRDLGIPSFSKNEAYKYTNLNIFFDN